jgi:hypothetical protein
MKKLRKREIAKRVAAQMAGEPKLAFHRDAFSMAWTK